MSSSEVIGVDLGGTKVAVARLSGRRLSTSKITPTDRSSSEAIIEQVASTVEAMRDAQLDAVGIGVPSVVDFQAGRVISSVNLPLADVPLRDLLSDRLGVPVFVDNDATVAALAEAHDDALKMVARDLVMMTIGTGVGGGFVLGGRIYRGATGGAGEIGHTLIAADLRDGSGAPRPTGFPQEGSLEREAAGHALDELAGHAARQHPDSKLGQLARDRTVTGVDAVDAAHEGDDVARDTVKWWAQRMGIGIANVINIFDPEEVVIGGGAARAGELLLGPAREVARGFVVPGLGRRTEIRVARHGVRAGVLGAALLAVHELADRDIPAPTEVLS